MREFDKINNTVDIRSRETTIKLRLKTYGTLEQCQKSIEKVAYELRLQGLDVEVDSVSTASDHAPGVLGGMIKVRDGDIYTSTETEQPNITLGDVTVGYGETTSREHSNIFESPWLEQGRALGVNWFDSIED